MLSVTAAGGVGEIWLSSPSAAQGYWNLAEATADAFRCHTNDTRTDDAASAVVLEYLRTGDLGCIVDNQLYVVGRIKDMIIVRGRNHYPQVTPPRMRAGLALFEAC